MSAVVYQLLPFQTAVEQARKLGTNVTMAVIRRVREEQRAGRSGNAVSIDLWERRMDSKPPQPPKDAA